MVMVFLIGNTTLAYESTTSDSQETVIKQVLIETGAEFGWDLGDCFYSDPAFEGASSVYHCPEVWGPRLMYEFKGDDLVGMAGAAYGLDVPILYGGWANEFMPIKIMAHPTEATAKAVIDESLGAVGSVAGFKITDFHNYTAISSDSFGSMEWQADRFFFTALGGNIGVPTDEIAEALYANAVKYGLIGDGGEAVLIPTQDSDGDGVTDDIDQCPGTPAGVAVDSSGCLISEINLTISTDKKTYSPEETVIIQGRIQDTKGGLDSAVVNFNVSSTDYSAKAKATADSAGNYSLKFPIPIDVTQGKFTLLATVSSPDHPSVSKSINFVVGVNTMLLEKNPTTEERFIGVAADGVSTLGVSISLPGCSEGCSNVYMALPEIGKLEGDAIDDFGIIKLDSTGAAELTYQPPAYLTKDQLTRNISVHEMGSRRAWAAELPLVLTYTDANEQEEKIEAEILVSRSPVMMVHGFLGATSTWGKLSTYLNGEKIDTFLGDYGVTNQSIEGLAMVLRTDIRKEKMDYANANIKLIKVDIVAHSMGGLISRYYSNGLPDYPGNVRKLIMVATPNHGVSWSKKITGNIGASWYQTHGIPAEQLYSESSFMNALNSGEKTGAHLNSDIQYGNIYGWSDDWVVSAASAYLNGVSSVSLSDVKHSPDIPGVPSVAITEYLKAWNQVENWLNSDIYRPSLKGSSVEIFKYTGDVYVKDYGLSSAGQEYNLTEAQTKIDSWQSVRTDQDSTAIIHLSIDGVPWGVIFLDPSSEIFLGHLSPQLVEVRLWQGSAAFRTKEDSHFTVPINIKRAENGEWWKYSPKAVVTGLNTEFAVTAGENIEVHSLEGKLVVETPDSTEKGTILSTNDSVAINGETVAAIDPLSKNDLWWLAEDDDFLNSAVVKLLGNEELLMSIVQNIKDNTIASITFIIALGSLIFLLFFAILKFAKKKIVTGILMIILGIISFCIFGGITLFFAINFDDLIAIITNAPINR